MTRLLPLVFPALLLGCLVASAPRATACDGGFGYGYGWGIGQIYNSLETRVPHFAAHPPVYYSYPVPRTYGHSPFAYPPHFRTPEIVGEMPVLEISNPYVTPANSTEPATPERSVAAPSEPEPLVVINPYVTQGVELAQTGE